jgi:hypothetical protein
MPVAGRKPRESGQIRHRKTPAHDWVEVEDVPYAGDVPDLPDRTDGWPAVTVQWWAAVSRMPHCVLWTDADWRFAIDTALVAAMFHEGSFRAATELRNREKVMGTTYDSRRDLRIRYIEPERRKAKKSAANGLTLVADDWRAS